MKLPIPHADAIEVLKAASAVQALTIEETVAIYLRATGILTDGADMLGAPVPDDWKPRKN